MKHALLCLPCLLALVACSSPPQPPTVDESRKRPANTSTAVELQVCRSDLQNTRILAAESAREAEAQGSAVARLTRQQRELVEHVAAIRTESAPEPADVRNTVYTVTFPFAGTRLHLASTDAALLASAARYAPLVLLRGRTDGTAETPGESRVARERAEAVRDWLVNAGVEPKRIRLTWQPVGDHAADNHDPHGRALNRRVEIELYHAAPRIAALGAEAAP
jgi:outer membrane protein OmpA-like peptidoglycan-associated protein